MSFKYIFHCWISDTCSPPGRMVALVYLQGNPAQLLHLWNTSAIVCSTWTDGTVRAGNIQNVSAATYVTWSCEHSRLQASHHYLARSDWPGGGVYVLTLYAAAGQCGQHLVYGWNWPQNGTGIGNIKVRLKNTIQNQKTLLISYGNLLCSSAPNHL